MQTKQPMPDQAKAQLALWDQRLLRGKLHLPYFTAEIVEGRGGAIDYSASLDTITQRPLCGRQLNNHREERSQQADRIEFAGSEAEFTYQLMSRRACTHCAVKAGLLVRQSREREEEHADDE